MGRFSRMIGWALVFAGLLSIVDGTLTLGFGPGATERYGSGPVVTIWTYVYGGIVLIVLGVLTPFLLPWLVRLLAERHARRTREKP